MSAIDRRRLLAASGAVGLAAAAPRLAFADAAAETAGRLGAAGHRDPARRHAHRPLPLDGGPDGSGVDALSRGPERLRPGGAGRIPGRDALAAKIARSPAHWRRSAACSPPGPYVFTELRPVGANTFKLYVREGIGRHRTGC